MSQENSGVVRAIIQEMQKTIDELTTEAQKFKYDLVQYSTKIDMLILEKDAALLREHHAKLSAASVRLELERTREELSGLHEYVTKLESRIEKP